MTAPVRDNAARVLSISEVAQRFGLRPSALRYYEQIGILPAPVRFGGKRRYGSDSLRRLAVIQRARQIGFSLDEIATLFSNFNKGAASSRGWRVLAEKKLTELDLVSEGIAAMRELLEIMKRCECNALDECGERMLRGCNGQKIRGQPPPASLGSMPRLQGRSAAARARAKAV